MRKLASIFILLLTMKSIAQIDRVEPPNWWTGFENQSLQLLIKGDGISQYELNIDHPGISLVQLHKADSPNYLFADIEIDQSAEPGKFDLVFSAKGKKKIRYSYELRARSKKAEDYVGFDSADVIYLITPDRFANGNPEIDIVKGMLETKIDRKDDYARHGGDIEGIRKHLDYIDDMGFTAIWSCPLLFNDMPKTSYHGYAITDLYQIDPRFGTMEDYVRLAAEARERGIKLIMDQVANHCGSEHWWMKDLPFKDWVNFQEGYEIGEKTIYSNHRRTTNQDIYASDIDNKNMTDGWFVETMPDLNQRNPYMAKYLVQNSIWWIEMAGLGGIRQDTYPYPDKDFMSEWAGAIMKEYPNFSIVGEEWSYNPLLVGYWQTGANNKDGYESNLRSPMDFPMQRKIKEAVTEEEAWDKGLVKIYEGLANDFHYTTPKDIMIFPDNHDMDRIHTQTGEDEVATKMAVTYHLMLPRIPQLYYGTEILMTNDNPGDHGEIRTDFPGGWTGDEVNAFTGMGLTEIQEEAQAFIKKVQRWRKTAKAVHKGKMIHYVPENGVYIYFRYTPEDKVMVVLNKNDQPRSLALDRFSEMLHGASKGHDIISGKSLEMKGSITVPAKAPMIIELK